MQPKVHEKAITQKEGERGANRLYSAPILGVLDANAHSVHEWGTRW